MRTADSLLVVALGVWFVVTLLAQFGPERPLRRLRIADRLGLLPRWAVFGPRPIDADRVMLYRDVEVTGGCTPWRELPDPPRGRVPWLWNPTKRVESATIALSDSLSVAVHRLPAQQMLVQVPYLLLLGRVSRVAAGPATRRRQFLIAQVRVRNPQGRPEVEPTFLSAYHRLPS